MDLSKTSIEAPKGIVWISREYLMHFLLLPPFARSAGGPLTVSADLPLRMDEMASATELLVLELATENAELRVQLAEAQDLLIETAVDAGELHARVEALQTELAQTRMDRDAWRSEATRRNRG